MQWTGGNAESPLMRPGTDCISCHASLGEGPAYAIAGTVFAGLNQASDCYGTSAAKVVLTGADGKVFTLTTNEAGNFFLDKQAGAALKPPYSAKIVVGDKVREMISKQSAGSCNSCHSATGSNGAPGRIQAP